MKKRLLLLMMMAGGAIMLPAQEPGRMTIPKVSKCYKHFYGWMYTEIYNGVRREGMKG